MVCSHESRLNDELLNLDVHYTRDGNSWADSSAENCGEVAPQFELLVVRGRGVRFAN